MSDNAVDLELITLYYRSTMLTSKALASTIMPLSDSDLFPLKKSRSKSSTATTFSRTYEDDFRDGLRIPLPPSSTNSQSEYAAPSETREEHIEQSAGKGHTYRLDDTAEEDKVIIESEARRTDVGAQDEPSKNLVPSDGKPDEMGRLGQEPGDGEPTSNGAEILETRESPENIQQETIPMGPKDLDSQKSDQGIGESVGIGDAPIQASEGKGQEGIMAPQVERADTDKSMEEPGERPSEGLSEDRLQQPEESTHMNAVTEDIPLLDATDRHAPSQEVPLVRDSIVSLQEVGLLARRRDYDHQCLRAMQDEVKSLMNRCASVQRRICLQSHLYSLMLDHFRSENRTEFSSIYQKSVEARDASTNAKASIDSLGQNHNGGPSSFKDNWATKLSPNGSKTVIQVLHQIREVPAFLPDCLANLSSYQIGSLSQKSPNHSVAPSPQPGGSGSIFSRSLDWSRHGAESLLGTKSKSEEVRHSPLALMAYGLFDSACSPTCRERRLLRERLVDSCVRLVSNGKKGSNDFLLAVLDTLVESSPWPSKLQVEQYITKLIQDGDFVLESSELEQVNFSEAAAVNNARNAVAIAEFYDRGLRSLLDLLTKDPSCNAMPDGMLDFVRAILSKIRDSRQRSKARDFFVLRWYCSAFLSKALMYPEASFTCSANVLCCANYSTDAWLDDATSH